MDIALAPSFENFLDLCFEDDDLVTDEGLDTAIFLSLFLDARATPDELPPGEENPRGWWGDLFSEDPGEKTGSKLWLLNRSTHTDENRALAKQFAEDALAWIVEDQVAQAVTVSIEKVSLEESKLSVVLSRPRGRKTDYRFEHLWRSIDAA